MVTVTIKDTKTEHTVELAGEHTLDDAVDAALTNLAAWAREGTTKVSGRLEVIGVQGDVLPTLDEA